MLQSCRIKRIEVIDFRLFRATELAFAIRPKDGVARQGRRGGFHCYCPKACWNNFSVVVRVRGRATGLVFASCPKDCFIFKVQCLYVQSSRLYEPPFRPM